MIHDFYQHLGLAINPIAFSIGSLAVRWYGLMYLVGFLLVYGLLRLRILGGEFPVLISKSQISTLPTGRQVPNKIPNSKSQIKNLLLDYLLLVFFAAIVGGRMGYVLFYGGSYFLANPLAIISPFDENGSLVGLYGMSYHGALLAIIIGSWIFLKKKGIDFRSWADFVIPGAAVGYFFGRIGNFLNGELYGSLTDSPLGMYFAADPFRLRHPSQLYEAFLEGILLPVILWKMRWKKKADGFLLGIYLTGYGLLRIVAEQFREPDAQLGFLWKHLTMGQLLSLVMIAGGAYLLFSKKKK